MVPSWYHGCKAKVSESHPEDSGEKPPRVFGPRSSPKHFFPSAGCVNCSSFVGDHPQGVAVGSPPHESQSVGVPTNGFCARHDRCSIPRGTTPGQPLMSSAFGGPVVHHVHHHLRDRHHNHSDPYRWLITYNCIFLLLSIFDG